jgi:hypothetical protein
MMFTVEVLSAGVAPEDWPAEAQDSALFGAISGTLTAHDTLTLLPVLSRVIVKGLSGAPEGEHVWVRLEGSTVKWTEGVAVGGAVDSEVGVAVGSDTCVSVAVGCAEGVAVNCRTADVFVGATVAVVSANGSCPPPCQGWK